MSGANASIWYRQPLVWLLILFPLAAVVGGIITLFLAIESNDGLVADDYYQRGKEINQVLDRDLAAASAGLLAQVDLAADALTVRLSANAGYQLPEIMTLDLLHATRAGYDQHLTMTQTAAGVYRVPMPELVAGRWNLQLATDDWRLTGNLSWPRTRTVQLPMPDR